MIDPASVPVDLRARAQWVVWKVEGRHGRPTKVPYVPLGSGARASAVDPSSWRSFEQANAAFDEGHFEGLGYVLDTKDPFAGVDLDHCIDAQSGDVLDWASEIALDLNSYTEVTPSGAGLHIFVRGKLPNEVLGRKKGDVEMYCGKRFLTVTGRHVPGTPQTIEVRDASLALLYARYFSQAGQIGTNGRDFPQQVPGYELSDDEIIEIASRAANGSKFLDLWRGSWESHTPSRSEADAALLGILAFYSQEPSQLDRLMCQSGMARSKWLQRPDYRERTIRFVLSHMSEHYSPATRNGHTTGNHKEQVPPREETSPPERETGQAPDPQPQTEPVNKWADIPIGECGDGELVDWLWEGYIAPGVVTSLTALWKSGKTTLLAHLLKSADGSLDQFAGRSLREIDALIVTEEHQSLWAGRREELGLKDNISIIPRPFMGRPTPAEWTAFCLYLGDLVEKKHYSLVVFDTIFNLWCVTDENNNAEIIQALRPLHAITQHEVAVLLLAHPTKVDQGEGKSTRGGGAFGGFVDVITEMRRFDTSRLEDTRRVLTAMSRYKDTPPEIVIELDTAANAFRVVGTRATVNKSERRAAVLAQLPFTAPGLTAEEVHHDWGDDSVMRPSLSTIRRDLESMVISGEALSTGTGGRGDPKRFYRAGGARFGFGRKQESA
jgi:hypothetical protein